MSVKENPDLETFLFSAVHDMKNSITVLAAAMERNLIHMDPEKQEIYRDMSNMFYEVKRMNGNLTHILTLYKLGIADFPFYLDEYSLSSLLQDVINYHEALLRSMKIHVEIQVPDDLVWVYDEYLVTNVISQALNNALKYTNGRVNLIAREAHGRLEIRVEDNGRGYPPAMLACPAGDLHRGEFRKSGTGLGLYFASVVANLHRQGSQHGQIRLENGGSLGGGCFVLCLP